MIQATLDFVSFLFDNFTLLAGVLFYGALAVLFSKSIKRHAKVYYWVFGVISFAYIIPFLSRMAGYPLPINLGKIPFVGMSMDELSHAAWFIHPVIVIIMYMGAFSPKIPMIGKLMSIRKELSIIVGFPVLAHGLKRVFASFPGGWDFYFNHDAFLLSRSGQRMTSELGQGITSFVFILGLVMFVLFIVLWVTSFDSVRKKMGGQRWKSVQRWSYGLYAMLFIHAVGLQLGGLISYNARQAQQSAQVQVSMVESPRDSHAPQVAGGQQPQPQQRPQRQKPFNFEQIEFSRPVKSGLNIFILFAVYGSYLILRLRKRSDDRKRR